MERWVVKVAVRDQTVMVARCDVFIPSTQAPVRRQSGDMDGYYPEAGVCIMALVSEPP
jgi:hypothetical protein